MYLPVLMEAIIEAHYGWLLTQERKTATLNVTWNVKSLQEGGELRYERSNMIPHIGIELTFRF